MLKNILINVCTSNPRFFFNDNNFYKDIILLLEKQKFSLVFIYILQYL